MVFSVDENEFVAAQQDLDVLLPAAGAGGCQKLGCRPDLVSIGPPSVQQVVQPVDGRNRIGARGDPAGQQVGPPDDEGAVEYEQLLAKGLPMQSEAMKQLQEDAFHLASWESQVPCIS